MKQQSASSSTSYLSDYYCGDSPATSSNYIDNSSEEEEEEEEEDLDEYIMLTQNAFDHQKARSNHWFFSYIPTTLRSAVSTTVASATDFQDANNNMNNNMDYSAAAADQRPLWRRYTFYSIFVVGAVLSLLVNVTWVHPTNDAWYNTTLEAYSWPHEVALRHHQLLAEKYKRLAHWEIYQGQRLRAAGAHGFEQGQVDARNATELYQKAKQSWLEAQQDQKQAQQDFHEADQEQRLYQDYERNATLYAQKAKELEQEAHAEHQNFGRYRNISLQLFSEVVADEDLEQELLQNATLEGETADNITQAEKDKEEHLWFCQYTWKVCSIFGGYAELGKADDWKEKEVEDYQEAMGVQQQLLVAETDAMIARTKALRARHEARIDHYEALQDKNESLVDEQKAEEARAVELQDLQEALEFMRERQEHLHELEHYEHLEVALKIRSEKETEYGVGEWRYGTELLQESARDKEQAAEEDQLVQEEIQQQNQLINQAIVLGRRLRWYSVLAAVFAVLALIGFGVALVRTNHVALGYQLKAIALASVMTVSRRWQQRHRRNASWEGRSILGGNENRNSLRQLSCWCHHGLIFVVVMAMLGDSLESIFEYEDKHLRGEVLLEFAVLAGLLETMLFQGIPNAAVLDNCWTREYFQNVGLRWVSSSCRFAIQMLLVLVLFGQGSEWLFGLLHFLDITYFAWIGVLVVTVLLHFWYIEIPYALSFSGSGLLSHRPMSDITYSSTYQYQSDVTIEVGSLPSSRANTPLGVAKKLYHVDEEGSELDNKGATIATLPMGDEAESLLSSSREERVSPQESVLSLPYSSISLGDSNESSERGATSDNFYASPAMRQLYCVSFWDELYGILAHLEMLLLVGCLLVICNCLPHIAHRYHYHPIVTQTM